MAAAAYYTKKGLWIPSPIRVRDDLNYTERCLLAEIHNLCGETHDCFATNGHLAGVMGRSVQYIANVICRLAKDGFLRVQLIRDCDRPNGRRRLLRVLPEKKWPAERSSLGSFAHNDPSYSKCEEATSRKCEPPLHKNVNHPSAAPLSLSTEITVVDNSGGGEACGTPPACACAHETAAAAAKIENAPPTPATAMEQGSAPVVDLSQHPHPAPDPRSVALLADFLGESELAANLAGRRPPDEIDAIIRHAQRPGVNYPQGLVIQWLKRGDPPPVSYMRAQRQALDRGDVGPVSTGPKPLISLDCPCCGEGRSLVAGSGTVVTCGRCLTPWRENAAGLAETMLDAVLASPSREQRVRERHQQLGLISVFGSLGG